MKQKQGFSGERSIVLPQAVVDMERNDPLASALYITDIGYYPRAENHYRERRNSINEHVLIYCMEGTGWFSIHDRKYPVRANQFFILPAGHPHAYGSDADHPWTIYWLHFAGEQADIYAQGAQQPEEISPAINSRISDRNHLFEEIFHTLELSTDRESLRYASSLLHYYLGSMRYLVQFRHADNNAAESDIIDASIHYIKENIERHITLQQIAHFTGYSPSRFAALFKEQTGKSPITYINHLRMEQASRLLRETDMKVNQICYKVGIDDCYYFSRLFTKIVGMAPKKYREQSTHS